MKKGIAICGFSASGHLCASVSTLWHKLGDENSRPDAVILCYAENLKKHEIPFEMHIFPKGGHGESWCDSTIWATPMRNRDYNYIRLSIEWMRELFGLMEAK